jgi:REP element-mobilizing transposase RayT
MASSNYQGPRVHHRRSIRLRGFDYAGAAGYFVTICVPGHACVLGDIRSGVHRLSPAGLAVERTWLSLPKRFPAVHLDIHVVMPNHFHGILWNGDPDDGAPDGEELAPLGRIVGAFKSLSTAAVNGIPPVREGPLWQRGYYEHIIDGERELRTIRGYIEENPVAWPRDRYYRGEG